MNLGIFIEGEFETSYGEGLFQYLALLAHGLPVADVRICVVVSTASKHAFTSWVEQFPDPLNELIDIVAAEIDAASLTRQAVAALEQQIDCWLFVRPDSPVLHLFHKPRCAIFADLVTEEYPAVFSPEYVEYVQESVNRNIAMFTGIVCFSRYVRDNHIVRRFGIGRERISIIPHPRFDYAILSNLGDVDRSAAAQIIRTHLGESAHVRRDPVQHNLLDDVLKQYPFEDVPYVLVSSRNRPHKNFVVVAKALEILMRRYVDVKIITTAVLDWDDTRDALVGFLSERGLLLDFISINNVPSKVHAALYKCAALTVHPSPFEGGFPFTVFESLSLGTPILVADGPAIREVLDVRTRDIFCFDPASSFELAERIEKALRTRGELIEQQQEALSNTAWRSPEENMVSFLKLANAAIAEEPAPPALSYLLAGLGASAALTKGGRLVSRNGRFAIVIDQRSIVLEEQGHGRREVIARPWLSVLAWAFGTENGLSLLLEPDGNLVVQWNRRRLYESRSGGAAGIYRLTLDDAGRLVISRGRSSDPEAVVWTWSSGSWHRIWRRAHRARNAERTGIRRMFREIARPFEAVGKAVRRRYRNSKKRHAK